MADLLNTNPNETYGDDAIVTLSPREHIRLRPGMYIGKLGDGSQADDGIYVLIKEVVDNSETAAASDLSGMPRPKSRTETTLSSIVMSISRPAPMMNSSTELSTTSLIST